jgi:hypothetical protein
MNTLKAFLKRFLIILLSLTGLVLLAFGVYVLISQGTESDSHQAYLKKNMEQIPLDASPAFRIFDQDFYKNQVILLGETHGYQVPQELDFVILKHLNARAGVRNYLAEVDYCQAWFLNKYLRTGNENFLKTVFKPWINQAQWGSEEFYNKIKKIHALNASLPADRQIRFLGIDKIHSVATVKAFLREFLDEVNYQSTPGSQIDSLRAYLLGEAAPKEAIGRVAGKVLEDIDRKEAFYRNLLGEHCTSFRHFIQNVAYLDSDTPTDSLMLSNLTFLTNQLGLAREKMYGLWGYYHTLQSPLRIGVPFAALIKRSDLPFRDKVVSLNILSLGSDMMIPPGFKPQPPDGKVGYFNNNGPFVFVDGIKDLKAVTAGNSVTIFKLDKPESPYRQSQKLARVKTWVARSFIPEAGAVTTDLFQYVVLVRDSEALTPLRN